MALKITSLAQLSTEVVQQSQQRISRLIVEKYPDVDTSRGVIHDLIAFLAGGIVGGLLETEIQRLLDSRSLLAISKDPSLADTELVDHILSNFRISRTDSEAATGEVRIIVSGNTPISVPKDTIFTANNVTFNTDDVYIARPVDTLAINPTDRVLRSRNDGKFEFVVPVTCTLSGTVGNIKSDIPLTVSTALPGFVAAVAASDFTGGSALESNTELIARMQTGIPAKVLAGAANVTAVLTANYLKGASSYFSVLGFGDAEQTRDQLGLFPISSGSRTDVYIKNRSTPVPVKRAISATVISKTADTVIWRATLQNSDFPGFYKLLTTTRLATAASLVVQVTKGYDTSGSRYATPAIRTELQSVFSAYQTAVLSITEVNPSDMSALIVGSIQTFDITAATVPGLDDAQDFVNHPNNRAFGGDILVKGAVPCFVSATIEVIKPLGDADPDILALQNAVSQFINGLAFKPALYATQISPVVNSLLPVGTIVSKVTLLGEILRPDGQTQTLTGAGLELPNLPTILVTPRTTAFFAYSDDVRVNVTAE